MSGRYRLGGGLVRRYEKNFVSSQPETLAPICCLYCKVLCSAANLKSPSHEPEEVQVTLSLRATTTSAATISLDNDPPEKPFYIQVHVSIKSSTHPTLPVTLATFRTPLERTYHCTSARSDCER